MTIIERIWRAAFRRLRRPASPERPIPGSEEKRARLLKISRQFRCVGFVETGTFTGDTVEYMKPHFQRVVSIELSPHLAKRAQGRFAKDDHVEIVQGDSSRLLGPILNGFDGPVLLWLDGHYSYTCTVDGEQIETALGDEPTPILKELESVFSQRIRNHLVVIDDARLFTGQSGYPTIAEIERAVSRGKWKCTIEIANDMITLLPSASYPAR